MIGKRFLAHAARDDAWEKHTTSIEKEDKKAGITVTVKGWKCNHCNGEFWNSALQRLFEHLTCDAALCKAGISPCNMAKVPEAVRDNARSQVMTKAENKNQGEKRKAMAADIAAEAGRDRAEQIQGRIRGKTVETCEVDAAICDFFNGHGIADAKVRPLNAPLRPGRHFAEVGTRRSITN